jgi:uncharacterized tellurite resistance protein B-like protein
MFGRWLKKAVESPPPQGAELVYATVRRELPEGDEETVLVVTAMVGLLGVIAYADRDYSAEEEQRVRTHLARVMGLSADGIEAIVSALRTHIVEVSAVQAPRYARVLRELADHELRVQVLELMLEIAAADAAITTAETNTLRQLTTALGLDQDDYNRAQEAHRHLLSALRS